MRPGCSEAQSQRHPFEQEFWGLLQLRREIAKHFGRIPMVIHTDHANLVRLEYLPLDRIDANCANYVLKIVSKCFSLALFAIFAASFMENF